jgi:hypothetical protein
MWRSASRDYIAKVRADLGPRLASLRCLLGCGTAACWCGTPVPELFQSLMPGFLPTGVHSKRQWDFPGCSVESFRILAHETHSPSRAAAWTPLGMFSGTWTPIISPIPRAISNSWQLIPGACIRRWEGARPGAGQKRPLTQHGFEIDKVAGRQWSAGSVAAATGYKPSMAIQPLWQAAGLTQDPFGFFDISFLTTATNVGAAVKQTMRVRGVRD